jgi:hypothetical protein
MEAHLKNKTDKLATQKELSDIQNATKQAQLATETLKEK